MFSRKLSGFLIAVASVLVMVIAAFFIYQKYLTLPPTPDEINIWYDHSSSNKQRERYHFGLDASTVVVFEDGKIANTDQNIEVNAEQLQQLYGDLGEYFSPSAEVKSDFPDLGDKGLSEMTAVKIRWVKNGQTFEGTMIEPDVNTNAAKVREIVESFAEARISERDSSR